MLLLYIRKIQNVKRALENHKIAEMKNISIGEMDDKFEDLRKQSKKTKEKGKQEKRQKNKRSQPEGSMYQ